MHVSEAPAHPEHPLSWIVFVLFALLALTLARSAGQQRKGAPTGASAALLRFLRVLGWRFLPIAPVGISTRNGVLSTLRPACGVNRRVLASL